MMKIHGTKMSFNTWKVLYTLEEIGQDYEFAILDMSKGEHQQPEHLKRHPIGKTPTLTLENGKTLFESGAICRYLANQSQTDLYGKNDWERAHTDQWMDFFSIHPGRWLGTYAFEKVVRAQFGMGEPNLENIKEAEGFLEKQMQMVNQHLASQKHLAGDTFTIADLFAFAYIETSEMSQYPLEKFKSLSNWYSALKERPSALNAKKKNL